MGFFEFISIMAAIIVTGICVLAYICGHFGLLEDQDKKKNK